MRVMWYYNNAKRYVYANETKRDGKVTIPFHNGELSRSTENSIKNQAGLDMLPFR